MIGLSPSLQANSGSSAVPGGDRAHFTLFPTPIGDCAIAWRRALVVATQLPERSPTAIAARLARDLGATEGKPSLEIWQAVESMTALLEGEKIDLSTIRCSFDGCEAFALDFYAATRAIPACETRTYGAIASELGDKAWARRVGRALGQNPIPIIVPCHRVVGANQKLTGFSAHGGVETKRRMLEIEGARVEDTPSLFPDLGIVPKR